MVYFGKNHVWDQILRANFLVQIKMRGVVGSKVALCVSAPKSGNRGVISLCNWWEAIPTKHLLETWESNPELPKPHQLTWVQASYPVKLLPKRVSRSNFSPHHNILKNQWTRILFLMKPVRTQKKTLRSLRTMWQNNPILITILAIFLLFRRELHQACAQILNTQEIRVILTRFILPSLWYQKN